jgi:mono/diheme cytochrome c family protein
MRRICVLVAVTTGWLACGATLPRVTPDVAETTGIPFHTLATGRERYASKCGGCHPLYAPASRTDAEWEHEVTEMRDRARLADDDVRAILAYLQAMNPTVDEPEQTRE